MDPADPNTLYAAMWQRVRRKWSDPRDRARLLRRRDLENDRRRQDVDGSEQRVARAAVPRPHRVDVARSNPNVVYAFVDNYEPGRPPREGERDAYTRPIFEARIKSAEMYRSDNKGATWRKVTENNDFMTGHSGTYGWVFGQIRVDPTDENSIYTLGLGLNVSRDAGKSFTTLRGMHGDHHGALDRSRQPRRALQRQRRWLLSLDGRGQDLGVRRTAAGGIQFYNVTLDDSSPLWAYGSDSGLRQPPGRRRYQQGT